LFCRALSAKRKGMSVYCAGDDGWWFYQNSYPLAYFLSPVLIGKQRRDLIVVLVKQIDDPIENKIVRLGHNVSWVALGSDRL